MAVAHGEEERSTIGIFWFFGVKGVVEENVKFLLKQLFINIYIHGFDGLFPPPHPLHN